MTERTLHAPENKAADPSSLEVVTAFDEFMRSFEAFKEVNDERLAEIESRMSPDVVTSEKLARLDEAVDRQQKTLSELSTKTRRPALQAADGRDEAAPREHKAAFDTYVRRGEVSSLKSLESKALASVTDA